MRPRTAVPLAVASLVALAAACREPIAVPAGHASYDAAATPCPTRADVVVSDKGSLSKALKAATPGEVIALNGFITVDTGAVIGTPNVTLTCATPGSGLTLTPGGIVTIDAVLNAVAPGDAVEHLVVVGTADADAFFAGAANVRLSSNTVTCAFGNVGALFDTAPDAVITGNEFDAAGCFDGLHLQALSDNSRVEHNTFVATQPNTALIFGAIRARDGIGVMIANNTVTGPWQNGISLADFTNGSITANRVTGVLVFGIRGRAGASFRPGPVSVDGNVFSGNVITGSGAAGIFLTSACNNTLLGNNLQGNAGNVGAIFDTPTGANVFVGNVSIVIDNGSFDCNGDGVIDPNIIGGPGRVLHGPFGPVPGNVASTNGKLR